MKFSPHHIMIAAVFLVLASVTAAKTTMSSVDAGWAVHHRLQVTTESDGDSNDPVAAAIPSFSSGGEGDGSNDSNEFQVEVCEAQMAKVETCATEKCAQCQLPSVGNDVGGSTEAGLNCTAMEHAFCSVLEEGKQCCSKCREEIDEYRDCALDTLRTLLCPDISCIVKIVSHSGGSRMTSLVTTLAFAGVTLHAILHAFWM